MPLENPITPGRVDWTGENPGIMLKNRDGSFSAMALFFRVAWSPAGTGELLLLYGSPAKAAGSSELNLLWGDNPDLADYLMREFIGRLAAFREAPPYSHLEFEPVGRAVRTGDPMGDGYSERVGGPGGRTVELAWSRLEAPRALELVPEQTGTKRHVMFTVLVPALEAAILVDGKPLPGEIGTRVQAGMETTTAFLYFSETWIIPESE